jgi:hypothetical protein
MKRNRDRKTLSIRYGFHIQRAFPSAVDNGSNGYPESFDFHLAVLRLCSMGMTDRRFDGIVAVLTSMWTGVFNFAIRRFAVASQLRTVRGEAC